MYFKIRCKSLDASADGYARGEAAGVYVLGDISDVPEHGMAVIMSAVINQDGRSSSLTAPK